MPVTVRNTLDNIVTFYDNQTKQEYLWERAGDASGRDVQQVPDDVAGNVQFMRAMHLGILTQVSDEVLAQTVAGTTPAYNPNRSAATDAAASALAIGDEEKSIVTITLEDDGEGVTGGGTDFKMGRVDPRMVQEQVEQSRGGD